MTSIPTFLPGRFVIGPGDIQDYARLERFHYRGGRPATWARISSVRYHPSENSTPRLAAVGVLSYPVPSCLSRRQCLGLACTRDDELRFANRYIRTISRVIVHPQFRALGLSTALVKWMCTNCDTRYVEAMAIMGRAHPLFELAGMTRVQPARPDAPIYYIFDRRKSPRPRRQ